MYQRSKNALPAVFTIPSGCKLALLLEKKNLYQFTPAHLHLTNILQDLCKWRLMLKSQTC